MAHTNQSTAKTSRRLGATIYADTPVVPTADTYANLLRAIAEGQTPNIGDHDFQLMLDAAGKTVEDFSNDLDALTSLHATSALDDVVSAAKTYIAREQAAAQARIAGAIRCQQR